MEAVILIGVQGAGKSTFYVERFFHTHVRLSMDLLKTRTRETALLESCLESKQPFVVDNTNVLRQDRARYIAAAHGAGFNVVGYYFDVERRALIKRNSLRAGKQKVPVPALLRTLKRLEPPELDEGFDELFKVELNAERQFVVTPVRHANVTI